MPYWHVERRSETKYAKLLFSSYHHMSVPWKIPRNASIRISQKSTTQYTIYKIEHTSFIQKIWYINKIIGSINKQANIDDINYLSMLEYHIPQIGQRLMTIMISVRIRILQINRDVSRAHATWYFTGHVYTIYTVLFQHTRIYRPSVNDTLRY